MKLNGYEDLVKTVEEAELVLIGLGEEWVLTHDKMVDDLIDKDMFLRQLLNFTAENEKYYNVYKMCQAYYYKKFFPASLRSAYCNLLKLIEDKNYFVVSLTLDSYLKECGFNADRIVNPCGTYEKLQCVNGCENSLCSSETLLLEFDKLLFGFEANDCIGQEEVLTFVEKCDTLLTEYKCSDCNASMCFNHLDSGKYCEAGYLEQWQKYMKWLQGTLNHRLCVIEAGVGMKLPSVIRWPFEKTVFYNQKSNMFRIHNKFYQINEEVAQRAYSVECDAVKFFCKVKSEAI